MPRRRRRAVTEMSAAAYRKQVSERAFQRQVERMLDLHGWWWFHDEDARRNRAGLPDLLCVHPRHGVYYIELKTETGKIRPAQITVIDLLRRAGSHAFIARPHHGDALERLFAFGDVADDAFEIPTPEGS